MRNETRKYKPAGGMPLDRTEKGREREAKREVKHYSEKESRVRKERGGKKLLAQQMTDSSSTTQHNTVTAQYTVGTNQRENTGKQQRRAAQRAADFLPFSLSYLCQAVRGVHGGA